MVGVFKGSDRNGSGYEPGGNSKIFKRFLSTGPSSVKIPDSFHWMSITGTRFSFTGTAWFLYSSLYLVYIPKQCSGSKINDLDPESSILDPVKIMYVDPHPTF